MYVTLFYLFTYFDTCQLSNRKPQSLVDLQQHDLLIFLRSVPKFSSFDLEDQAAFDVSLENWGVFLDLNSMQLLSKLYIIETWITVQ